MSGSVRWLGYPLVLLAVFVLIGGHWAVLQSVAWAGMLADYSRTDGLATGVEKTFSGEHPCKMCVKIEDGKKQEAQKAPLLKAEKKAEIFCERFALQFTRFSSPQENLPRLASDSGPSRRDAPLSPPPQTLS